jgi:hypothetical protein
MSPQRTQKASEKKRGRKDCLRNVKRYLNFVKPSVFVLLCVLCGKNYFKDQIEKE